MHVCGICRVEAKPQERGFFFHACDDWLHLRLFVCDECLKSLPLQRSLHEMCGECVEHLTTADLCDLRREPNTRFATLAAAIREFDSSHADPLALVPWSADPDSVHLGTLHARSKPLATGS